MNRHENVVAELSATTTSFASFTKVKNCFVQILNIVNHKLDSVTLAYFYYSGQEYLVGVVGLIFTLVYIPESKQPIFSW